MKLDFATENLVREWFIRCFGKPAGKPDYYNEWVARFNSGFANAIAHMDGSTFEVFLKVLYNSKHNLGELVLRSEPRECVAVLAGQCWFLNVDNGEQYRETFSTGQELVNFLNEKELRLRNRDILNQILQDQLKY